MASNFEKSYPAPEDSDYQAGVATDKSLTPHPHVSTSQNVGVLEPCLEDDAEAAEENASGCCKSSCCPNRKKCDCVQKMGSFVSHILETAFYKLGFGIATRPWSVIFLCFLLSAVCGVGMLWFDIKDSAEPIWIPTNSHVLTNQKWVSEQFPVMYRYNLLMITADNVLSPDVLIEMYDIDRKVKALYETNNTIDERYNFNWSSICIRIPEKCWSSSLLELYKFDINQIYQVDSTFQIIKYLQTVKKSPTYLTNWNPKDFLGGILYDESGKIISAKATLMLYVIKATSTDEMATNIVGPDLLWEEKFLELAHDLNSTLKGAIKSIEVQAIRSFRDESDNSYEGDIVLLAVGICVIITYVAIIMGRFNEVEHKVYLALVGVSGVGLATMVSYGLASALGQFYGPIHPILPFLLLGLGVDDMFVIVEAWNNLSAYEKNKDLPIRVALTMKHAGVSITVTSITDFVAFAIGASTALPALRSFCVYAALGILFLFIIQSTFFVAWLTIDQRRQDAARDACCICIKYYNFTPNKCSQKEFLPWMVRKWLAPGLTKLPTKVFVIVMVGCVLAISSYGTFRLSTESDIAWFLPPDSYLTRFLQKQRAYFNDGTIAHLYIGNISYYDEQEKITSLISELEQSGLVQGSFNNWYTSYISWLKTSEPHNFLRKARFWGYIDDYEEWTGPYPPDENMFYFLLNIYVSQYESQYYSDLKWNDTNPRERFRRLEASKLQFKVVGQNTTKESVEVLGWFREFGERHVNDDAFVWGPGFRNWETNRVIGSELYTNLALAFTAVFVVTLVLVANIWVCVLVCITVIITLVNVCGFMHYWGLTIDIMTSILLILSIGLAIDYSAHIGHTFMTLAGSRNERAKLTVATIGSAIINGGFSTFLAFVLCATSSSYVFTTFFKVFFLVVVFGLFNGLVLLPVLLSWFGPLPYKSAIHKSITSSLSITLKDLPSLQTQLDRCDINKILYNNKKPASDRDKVEMFIHSLPPDTEYEHYSLGEIQETHSDVEMDELLNTLETSVNTSPDATSVTRPLLQSETRDRTRAVVHQSHEQIISNCEKYLKNQT